MFLFLSIIIFFFFNDTATTEIYTLHIVGSVRCVQETAYAQLVSREGKFATIKLPSGETRIILQTCKATVGAVSNPDHSLEVSGKAGRSRWLGRRPRTRGVVMNPVDHPMGGGEGRATGGHPRSRNGMPAKGFKTRAKKKQSNKYIIERRKKQIENLKI
eukprot:TRINITY_DN8819_c0_g1_i1.p1 TRINITY_DN8819_c0_g1~~TRINITY_DN8819_c0_g1_i1.p1  ORF type:complete len:159 (-),score=30.58 TRINITY_DN8819_c0_g1_i1:381-857(-)